MPTNRPSSARFALRQWNWVVPAFVAPAALILIVLMALPMANAVVLTFQFWNGMTPPSWIGLSNYQTLFSEPLFWSALRNTAYYTIATVVLKTSLPLILASLLSSGVRFSVFFRTMYFMPVVISLAISGLLWKMIYEPNFGLLNETLRFIGLGNFTQIWLGSSNTVMPSIIAVSLWQGLGFYLLIFYAAIQGVPSDLYDAAKMDNANALRRFWHVTVPMLRPVIVLVIVLNTINGVKVFDQVWAMTAGGPNHASDTLGTYLYSTAFGSVGNPQFGYATTIAMVILVLSAVLSIIQIRIGRRQEVEY